MQLHVMVIYLITHFKTALMCIEKIEIEKFWKKFGISKCFKMLGADMLCSTNTQPQSNCEWKPLHRIQVKLCRPWRESVIY
jgi:hypothetical protein